MVATTRRTLEQEQRATIQVITPETATAWLEAFSYQHQRSLRSNWAEFLAEEMRRGNFRQRTTVEIIHFGGQQHLIDGQHRLWAVVLSGTPQTFTVVESRAKTAEEVAWAYGNTDIGLRRTGNDLYSALGLTQTFGLTKTDVGNLSAAISFMASGCIRYMNGNAKLHRDDIVKRMGVYAPYMRQYVELITECDQNIRSAATRGSTLAIVLLSLRFSSPRAIQRDDPSVLEFWKGVVFDDGIQIGDPRKLANRHLLSTTVSSASRNADSRVTVAYSSRFIVNTFNAFMQRREIKQTKVFDEIAPLNMYGVPSDITQWW